MRTKTRAPAPRFPKERMSRARTTRIASSMRTKRYRYRKRSWETKSAGSPSRRKPRQMPGKEVVAISRRAALIVSANFTRIDAKETPAGGDQDAGSDRHDPGVEQRIEDPDEHREGGDGNDFFRDETGRDVAEGPDQDREQEEGEERQDLVPGEGDDHDREQHRGDHLGARVQPVDDRVPVGEAVQSADAGDAASKLMGDRVDYIPGRADGGAERFPRNARIAHPIPRAIARTRTPPSAPFRRLPARRRHRNRARTRSSRC